MTFFQRIKTPFTEGSADEQARLQPRMRLIGELLQERREDLGLDLDEIGEMLRIKPAYLAALEQGRPHDLPGPAYAIGFVRAYADFLGLDSDQVLTRFKAEGAGVTARPDLALPVPLGERSLPGGALVLVAMILALCGYGIWYYLSTEERDRPERVAAVPAALQAPQTQPVLVPPLHPDTGATPDDANTPPTSPAGPGLSAAGQSPLASPPPSAPLQAPSSPSPPVSATQAAAQGPGTPPAAPPPAAAAKIAIRALTDCWIQVRASDQSIVFSRVLKSGEVYTVPARTGLSLRTGNAGALEIAVNGKTVPPIGGTGTLRRDVALDPTELAAGTAVHG